MKQHVQVRVVLGWASLTVGVGLCGCASEGVKVISDPDPSLKIPAIKAAAESKNLSDAKQLVKDLESDDPAVRFYSIGALERLTGQTYGYQYFMDEEKRAESVSKWKAWLSGWEAGKGESVKK